MELADLSRDRQVALVALIEALVLSDGSVSEGEQREIGKLAEVFGEVEYRSLLDEADARYADLESLKNALKTITDRDSRELILGIVLEDVMASPSVGHAQSDLLQWLAGIWNIQIQEAPAETEERVS